MTWNNRVFRHRQEVAPGEWSEYFSIHEAFYDENGKVDGWTDNPIAPYGDTVDDLIKHLEQMLNDANRSKEDVLDFDKPKPAYAMTISWSAADQAYIVEVPDLPGCKADGRSRAEAISNAEKTVEEWIATATELGREIPTPK